MNKQLSDQEAREMLEKTKEMPITNYSVTDVTAIKTVELVTSPVGYEDLFDNMPNGCAYYKVLLNESGNPANLQYLKVNSAYEKNIERPRIELIGKRVTEVFPHLTETSFQWIKTYMKVALSGEPVTFIQYFDHQNKWYSISAYSPQREYVVEIAVDITEQKQAQVQISEAQRQAVLIEKAASLGALAAEMANEVNQPLQALKIMADGMIYWYDKGKDTSMEKVIDNCRCISLQAGYITAALEWMQDLVNKASFDTPAEVDLNQMIKQALNRMQERIRVHGIQLRDNTCTVSPIVWGDSRRLKEIVMIILVNAIASLDCVDKDTKEIVISTSSVGDKAVIEISNNGPGIPDDIIGEIFKPFFSVAKSDAGLGMGLAIVKSIVNAYNGTVLASSVNNQVTFRIEFPLYVPSDGA